MKNCVTLFLIFFSLLLQGHEKPWKVTGQFTYTDNKPLSCHLFCSLSLLQETFDIETLRDDFYEEEMEIFLLNKKEN